MQFLHTKAWMISISTVAGWVAGHEELWQRYLWILPLMLFFGFSSNFTYALAGSLLRNWLAQGRRLLVFNRLMALALMATAAWILMGQTRYA